VIVNNNEDGEVVVAGYRFEEAKESSIVEALSQLTSFLIEIDFLSLVLGNRDEIYVLWRRHIGDGKVVIMGEE